MAGSRWRREVGPGSLGRGRRPAGPSVLGLAPARLRRTTRDAGIQVCGRGAGCGGLRGVLLGVAQLGDCGGQGHQVRDQRDRDQRGVTGDLGGQSHQPGSGAQAAPLAGGRGEPTVPRAGGPDQAVALDALAVGVAG